jgi:carbohydrate kinase (thermoresistant glucokinase family)
MIIVAMGVAGSGKTTVGQLLAMRLGWQFADADDYHNDSNLQKMRDGIPLSDVDRWPWLDRLAMLLTSWTNAGVNGVLACSALKQAYRRRLQVSDAVHFVYLKGNPDLLRARLLERPSHYMKATMLEGQLLTLEEPTDVYTVDTSQPPADIVEKIVNGFGLSN